MTSPTPAQETVDRLKPYVLDLLGTEARDTAVQSAATATAAATAAEAAKQRSEEIATSTSWDGDRLTVNGQTSPSLTGDVSLTQLGSAVSTMATWVSDLNDSGRNLLTGTSEINDPQSGSTSVIPTIVPEGLQIEARDPNFGALSLSNLFTMTPAREITVGKTYTFSFEVKSNNQTLAPRAFLGPGWSTSWTDMTGTVGPEFRQVHVTVTRTGGSSITPQLGFAQAPGTFILRRFQLEEGAGPTPWKPAPEDTGHRIEQGLPFLDPIAPANPDLKLRIDNSVGTRVFVGDTMIHGDTGWRNITAEVTNGWAAGSMVVRRIGNMVDFRVSGLDATNASGNTFLYMPTGFAPEPAGKLTLLIKHVETHGSSTQTSTGDTTGTNNNVFRSSVTTRFTLGTLSIAYFVSDPWPATLPGTPA